jgi:uncharacterized delta-60 repeat protein
MLFSKKHLRPRPAPLRPSFRPRLESLDERCLPSGGVLDPTFGSGGLVTNTTGPKVHAVATYPNEGTANDGKIVAVSVASGLGPYAYMAVTCYNLNGTLDSTFGGTGEVMNVKGTAWGVAVQADGKVVVAGSSTQGAFDVLRYNPDGSLDTSFGSKGQAVTSFSGTSYAFNLAVQADGKIVVADQTQAKNTGIWDIALARLNTNGSLDSSFGPGGKVVTQLPYSLDSLQYHHVRLGRLRLDACLHSPGQIHGPGAGWPDHRRRAERNKRHVLLGPLPGRRPADRLVHRQPQPGGHGQQPEPDCFKHHGRQPE